MIPYNINKQRMDLVCHLPESQKELELGQIVYRWNAEYVSTLSRPDVELYLEEKYTAFHAYEDNSI